ncbi:hypothetical protein BKA69DRAFT_1123039 [Paraphysoderma sedebokerense]|nr:hypothetical protein BKA69DRAFT_1123039 [Paraphysoderma sedebokerense]
MSSNPPIPALPLLKSQNPTLHADIQQYMAQNPSSIPYFTRLYSFFTSNKRSIDSLDTLDSSNGTKKSKVEEQVGMKTQVHDPVESVCVLKNIGFTMPLRKKADLHVTKTHILICQSASSSSNSVPVEASFHLTEFEKILCLSTPDKVKKQWTIVFIHKDSSTNGQSIQFSFPDHGADVEILWTPDSSSQVSNSPAFMTGMSNDKKQISNTSRSRIIQLLRHVTSIPVVDESTETGKFKGKKTNYVVAYYKNKEGFLFCLQGGLFFGFKKPLIFIAKEKIQGIQVMGITRMTFGIEVSCLGGEEKYVFEMIDQNESDSLGRYIQGLELDNSAKSNGSAQIGGVAGAIQNSGATNLKSVEFPEEDEEDDDFVASTDDDGSGSSESEEEAYEYQNMSADLEELERNEGDENELDED